MTSAKIVLCGDSTVGKTTISQQLSGKYEHVIPAPTVGAGFVHITKEIDDDRIEMNVWDTAGQETYRSLIKVYFRNADVAVVVFSLCSRSSFNNVIDWFQDVRNNVGSAVLPAGILIGNKADLVDDIEISDEEIAKLASDLNVRWLKTDATSRESVQRILDMIAHTLRERKLDSTSTAFRPISRTDEELGIPEKHEIHTEEIVTNDAPATVDVAAEKKSGCC